MPVAEEPSTDRRMRELRAFVPVELALRLAQLKIAKGRTHSEVVTEALEAYFEGVDARGG